MATKKSKKKNDPGGSREVTVTLTYDKPDAQSVFVAGDFCEWRADQYPLKKDAQGLWKITTRLAPGRYEYRFVVDGEWVTDPKCAERTANEFGGENCVLHL